MTMRAHVSFFFIAFLSALALSSSCGGTAKTPVDQDPYDVLASQGGTLDCLPSCLKTLAMECTGTGACTTAVGGGSGATAGTSYACYANGLKMTTTVSITMDGTQTSNVTASLAGEVCRRVDSTQGPNGASYSVADTTGVVATASITSFPGLSVTCGGQTTQLDRSTACGKLALLVLAGPKTPAIETCALGVCAP